MLVCVLLNLVLGKAASLCCWDISHLVVNYLDIIVQAVGVLGSCCEQVERMCA